MFRRSRRVALISALAATAVLLSACGGTPEPASTTQGEVDPDASLQVGLVLEPSNLDIRHTSGAALEQILIDNIYEGLVTRTQENEIVERLASEYTVSDDGLTYSFTLNDGILFHDGTPLTSADVVASYDAVRTDETVQGHAEFAAVASVSAPDATSVQIVLSQPDQNFLFSLTGPAGLVFKSGDATDLKTAENGTGPFTLTRWNKGSTITFARNEAYWGEPAGPVSEKRKF
jgi:peptide/nickel transport system substrate-binding protein